MHSQRARAARRLSHTILAALFAIGVVACGQGKESTKPAPAKPSPPGHVERPEDIPPPPAPPPSATAPKAEAPEAGAAEPSGGQMGDEAAESSAEDEELTQALNDLRSADPEVRADAVLDIEPEGVGLRYLVDTLRDPDPEVRMAAISQLEDADENPEAIAGIVSALRDDDSEVVLEAIDSLEFVGDASVISSLQPLLQHPNEEVREAAQEAIEYLEE